MLPFKNTGIPSIEHICCQFNLELVLLNSVSAGNEIYILVPVVAVIKLFISNSRQSNWFTSYC